MPCAVCRVLCVVCCVLCALCCVLCVVCRKCALTHTGGTPLLPSPSSAPFFLRYIVRWMCSIGSYAATAAGSSCSNWTPCGTLIIGLLLSFFLYPTARTGHCAVHQTREHQCTHYTLARVLHVFSVWRDSHVYTLEKGNITP